jgi:nucleotide-binding universal stress UspA family protein
MRNPRLLLAFDGSSSSVQAARLVAGWHAARATETLLLQVHRPLWQAWPAPGLDRTALEQALLEEGQAVLAPAVELLSAAGMQPRTDVRIGPVADTVLACSETWQPDALVLGTRGKGLLGGYALGSVALRVASAAGRPVLLVKADDRLAGWGDGLRVLLPVDGSAAGEEALGRFIALAPALGVREVALVHFQPALPLLAAIAPPHDDVLSAWGGQEAQRAVAGAQSLLEQAGLRCETHRLSGDPVEGVAAFAATWGAGLVAMATHGHSVLRQALGSVAMQTVLRSPVPVLLLR